MVRRENEQRQLPITELVGLFPSGLYLYYWSDNTAHASIQRRLHDALSDTLIVVTEKQYVKFPADLGTQIGDRFYGWSIGYQYIKDHLQAFTLSSDQEIEAILPLPQLGGNSVLEGGCTVPIGGTEDMIVVDRHWDSSLCESSGAPIRAINPPSLRTAMQQAKTDSTDWVFSAEHIDLAMTTFQRRNHTRVAYLDRIVYERLGQTQPADLGVTELRPFSHELAMGGGLNLKFMGSTVLVPSVERLGEIGDDLNASGYKIIEMGNDQVDYGGGVKCRSLDVRWRT